MAELDERESTHEDGLVQKALAEAATAARAQRRRRDIRFVGSENMGGLKHGGFYNKA